MKSVIALVNSTIDAFINELSKKYHLDPDQVRSMYRSFNSLNSPDTLGQPISPSQGKIRLGLCCINTVLRTQKPPVFCSRGLIKRTWTLKKAQALALQNIADIGKIVEWNKEYGISLLRLSSDIFPRFTATDLPDDFTIDFAIPMLKEIGEKIKGHRIVMHPGQYNQVGTPRKEVLSTTITDLSHHADILDALGVGKEGVIIIHGGGTFGDKEKTIERWISQFKTLPEKVKRRLALENCERGYSVKDCLKICESVGIPMIFDCHHYSCYNILHSEGPLNPVISEQELFQDLFPRIIATWKGVIPVMHISEQGNGRIGKHSDFIEEIPWYLLQAPEKYGINIDLEVEAKMKEQAIFKLYEKYNREFFRI